MGATNQTGARRSAFSFPIETDEGTISVDGDTIVTRSKLEDYRIESKNLLFISAMVYQVLDREEVSLCLVDEDSDEYYHKKYMPCHFRGFKTAFEWLQSRHPINDQALTETLKVMGTSAVSREPVERLIWRKEAEPNFELLSHFPPDIEEGLEVLAPNPIQIKWNTPYESVVQTHPQLLTVNDNGVYFNFPVRVGNLVIRSKMDYHNLTAKLVVPGAGAKSYFRMKEGLQKLFDGADFTAHEDKDKSTYYMYVKRGIVTFRLNYPFGGPYTTGPFYFMDNDLTLLSIEVDSPKSFDPKYESEIQVDGQLILADGVELDYPYDESHPEVQPRPDKITELFGSQPVIWVDRRNKKVGFADETNCLIRNLNDISSFSIQDFTGSGAGDCSRLAIADDDYVMTGAVYANPFKSIATELGELTGKHVTIFDDMDARY